MISLLAEDDAPFEHYTRQHRVIAWISRRLFDRITYTVRHGLLRGMRRRGGLGWLPAFLAREAETKEQLFWSGIDLTGAVVYDVGAYHGLLTMFFATRCSQVVSYEPNEINRARLIENVCLNNLINVQVRKFALGTELGSGTLRYAPEMAGGGTLDPAASAPASQAVEITTLDRDIAASALPAPDLIKIDVEGWELAALQGARQTLAQYHPILFLELHGETLREKQLKTREIVSFLLDAGYQDILHIETGNAIAVGNAPAEGHLYCQYTATNSSPFSLKATSAS